MRQHLTQDVDHGVGRRSQRRKLHPNRGRESQWTPLAIGVGGRYAIDDAALYVLSQYRLAKIANGGSWANTTLAVLRTPQPEANTGAVASDAHHVYWSDGRDLLRMLK
jgi:hypothetical protein